MAAELTRTSRELPNLDLLRAVAVLLVLADHVFETIGDQTGRSFHPYDYYSGRLGVLLFFVHTSLVLMASMERLGLRGWDLLRSFYIRRAFRIYPLSILTVLIVVVAGVPTLPWLVFEPRDTANIASNLLLTMNLTGSAPVLAPLWSLPLEVQMYMALPLIFLFLGDRRVVGKAFALFGAAVIAAYILPAVSFRLSVAAFGPCFMAGVIAYSLRDRMTRRLPSAWWPVALALTIAGYFAVDDLTAGIHPVALGWFGCLVVGLMIPCFRQLSNPLLNVPTHYIAKYSYGIYLFHCIAIWIGCYVLPLPAVWQWTVAATLLVALSVLSFHLLEQPAIGLGARVARRMNREPRQGRERGADEPMPMPGGTGRPARIE